MDGSQDIKLSWGAGGKLKSERTCSEGGGNGGDMWEDPSGPKASGPVVLCGRFIMDYASKDNIAA